MITHKLTVISLVLLVLTALTACDREPPKPQAIIVDFIAAAEAVNMAERVKQFSGAQNKAMRDELTALSKKLKQVLEDKKAGFGDAPTDEQQAELKTVMTNLQNQFTQRRMTLNTGVREEIAAFRQSVIDEIIPVARQVASEHGASIVLKSNPVLWSEETLDITTEVVSRLPAPEKTGPDATQ